MVLLSACVLCSLLGLRGLASPVSWQDQHENPGHRSEKTWVEQSVSSLPTTLHPTDSQSCTINSSANITNFVLREYQIETIVGDGDTTQLRGTLSVENPGSGDTYRLYRIPISVGGGVWSVCRAGQEAPLPSELVRCQYVLSRRSGLIGFRFQWYCDDTDSDRP